MGDTFRKYGVSWNNGTDPLEIELKMIKRGGKFINKTTKQECGLGLFEHFMIAREMLWPKRWRHKWVDLIYKEITQNIVTILMGSMSSGKTSIASEYVLIDYWASPENTMVLCSTTSMDKLKSGIFGEILMLFKSARQRHPWLAGNPLDFKCAITTEKLDEENDIRNMRLGVFGKALYDGRNFVGLGVFSGLKADRIRFVADEVQFCPSTFLDCLPNMIGSCSLDHNQEPDIKVIPSGNPKHDPNDQLGKIAEPPGGWNAQPLIEKTTAWNCKGHRIRCVNLIGTDSPNFDVPEGEKIPYPKIVNRKTISAVEERWGRDSLKFNEQCVGRMMIGFAGNRVITMDLCRNNSAMEKALWRDTERTRIGFVDPAWTSAGDRCIWGWLEFGTSNDGKQIMRYGGDSIIPLIGGTGNEPDKQIADYVAIQARELSIQSTNIFYGSTGRGTTGAAFATVFGTAAPVPIAEGGRPSVRPVRHDLFVEENGQKRHKRCDEEYSKFITELWFSVRNVIECGQMRELTEVVIDEGCSRQYLTVAGGKIEVESKDEMKETLGKSPDLFDALTFGVEGARQRGFQIRRLGENIIEMTKPDDWLDRHQEKYEDAVRSSRLSYA